MCGKPVRDWEGVIRFCKRPKNHTQGCNPFSDSYPTADCTSVTLSNQMDTEVK